MKRIGLMIVLGAVAVLVGGVVQSHAQQDSALDGLGSTACYGQVRLGYWVDMLRGPSYELYGVKRSIPAEQELRILGRDASHEWVQAYLPRVDIIGWMRVEDMLLYGACRQLVLVEEADYEPEPPPPAVDFVALPAFAADANFAADERVFVLDDGLVYAQYAADDLRYHVVLAARDSPKLRVSAALTTTPGGRLGNVSTAAADSNAMVAINADFWTRNRLPQNMMVVDGTLLTAPTNRATFAVTPDNTPFIGSLVDNWTWDASVSTADGAAVPLQLVNTGCDAAWVCLYTDLYDEMPLWEQYDGLRLLLSPTLEVLRMEVNTRFDIPAGHMVLRTGARSDAAAWFMENVSLGDTLRLSLPTDPDWQDFATVIGGGPLIVRDGEFWQDCDDNLPEDERICENFELSFRLNQYGRALQARSAIGYSDTAFIVVMVEGRGIYGSQGITQSDLADIFIRMGAAQAMEFDGGGSSNLWVLRNLVNGVPLESGERGIANVLLLFWDSDTSDELHSAAR